MSRHISLLTTPFLFVRPLDRDTKQPSLGYASLAPQNGKQLTVYSDQGLSSSDVLTTTAVPPYIYLTWSTSDSGILAARPLTAFSSNLDPARRPQTAKKFDDLAPKKRSVSAQNVHYQCYSKEKKKKKKGCSDLTPA